MKTKAQLLEKIADYDRVIDKCKMVNARRAERGERPTYRVLDQTCMYRKLLEWVLED